MSEPMFVISEGEMKNIIDLTEEMCETPGWVINIQPIANRRMAIINEIRSRPLSDELKKERGCVIEELSNETKIRNMHIENGEFELETEGVYGHQLIRLLTDFYDSNGGENYFTMTVCGRVRNKYRRYEITIRNADRDKTPADTIAELRKEIESLRGEP